MDLAGVYLSTVCAITVLAWACILMLARKSLGRANPGFRLLRLLMVLAWAYAVVPPVIQFAMSGRLDVLASAGDAAWALNPTADRALLLLKLALITTAAAAVVHYSRSAKRRGGEGLLAVALAPWALMGILAFREAQPVNAFIALYPLVAVAIWQARPPLEVFATLGRLTVATAGLSLFLGLFTDFGTMSARGFIDKAVLAGPVLAGPFSHPNLLGSVLSLGLPAVLLIPSSRTRLLGSVAVLIAVLWTASRTSIAAVIVVLGLSVVARIVKSPDGRRLAASSSLVAIAVVLCLVPLTATSPSAFNYRGRVWIGSLLRWEREPWLGSGPEAFRQPGAFANELGSYAFHGHNVLVHSLAVGGLTMVAVMGLLLFVGSQRGVRCYASGERVPYLFMVAFMIGSVLEVSTDFWQPSPTGLVVWFSFAAVLFAYRSSAERTAEVGGELPILSSHVRTGMTLRTTGQA